MSVYNFAWRREKRLQKKYTKGSAQFNSSRNRWRAFSTPCSFPSYHLLLSLPENKIRICKKFRRKYQRGLEPSQWRKSPADHHDMQSLPSDWWYKVGSYRRSGRVRRRWSFRRRIWLRGDRRSNPGRRACCLAGIGHPRWRKQAFVVY